MLLRQAGRGDLPPRRRKNWEFLWIEGVAGENGGFSTCCTTLRAEDVSITIRLLNGRNGKPITDENLNVFRNGSGFAKNYTAGQAGTIRVMVDRNATVSFASNIEVTCHIHQQCSI